MWSTEPYALKGVFDAPGEPMEVDGPTAAACRCLDDFDPLGPSEENDLTDYQTTRELLHLLDGWRWIPELGVAAVPCGDMTRMANVDELRTEIGGFLHGRVVWARNEVRRAEAADDREYLKRAKAYLKFANSQATAANEQRQAGKIASALSGRLKASDLDADRDLMGTPDGLLDLRSGRLLEEERYWLWAAGEDPEVEPTLVTKRTAARLDNPRIGQEFRYDPRWDAFVMEIMGGDVEKAAFLQRALGYSLLGGNPEKATFVLWGPNRNNGKSTLMNAVKTALGEYACSTDVGIVLEQRFRNSSAASPEVAKLAGMRLVDLPEPPAGARLDSSKVKLFASGTDSVTARFLNRDPFEFVPTFTLWMHCNSLPIVDDPSALAGGGMHVIEFTESFEGAGRDMSLTERFATPDGMATIMRWMLRGLTMYRQQGLNPPECVRGATAAWCDNSGTWLDRFLRDECRLGSGLRTPVAELKEAMAAYCEAHGEEMMTMRAVNRYLMQSNVSNKATHGQRFYYGIEFKGRVQKPAENPCRKSAGGKTTIRLG